MRAHGPPKGIRNIPCNGTIHNKNGTHYACREFITVTCTQGLCQGCIARRSKSPWPKLPIHPRTFEPHHS